MGAMLRVGLLVVCGCGRLGFDAISVETSDSDASTSQACGASTQAPDPIAIQGSTFRFTSFENTRAAINNVTVEAFEGDARLATVVSDDAGQYTLTLATGGRAPLLHLRYSKAGFFTSTVYLDAPLDRDIPRGDPSLLGPSDGPLWDAGAMDSVYATTTATLDPAKGTLNINVVDCAEQPLAGVEIALDTMPEVIAYLGTDGRPSSSATSTISPFSFAVGFNAPPGMTTVSATGGGRTFAPVPYPVAAGDQNTLVRVRPLD